MLEFLTDPILRGPTLGVLFMCIAFSLMGVILFLQKKTLLGESLSHATYPGVVGALILSTILPEMQIQGSFFLVLAGSLISSFLGLKSIHWLEKKQKVSSDAALTFVLAIFFGLGVFLVSILQATGPEKMNEIQTLLLGQAATMTDFHVVVYASLAVGVALFIWLVFRPLQALLFNSEFAQSAQIPVVVLEKMIFILLLFSLTLGMRSVGVILMSGMMVAPVIAARQFVHRLRSLFILAACFGAVSGLVGHFISCVGSSALSNAGDRLSLPTGPMIILSGTCLALGSLIFAPEKGWLFRCLRVQIFRFRCLKENILKTVWKKKTIGFKDLQTKLCVSFVFLYLALLILRYEGWIVKKKKSMALTSEGEKKAASIVRLHRLWEVYVSRSLGFQGNHIHQHAEEMEHVLDRDLELRLSDFLSHPIKDPHDQPIPEPMSFL